MLPDEVRALALMLPDVVAGAHMGKPDFRVHGRVFATLWTEEDRIVVKLTPVIQAGLTCRGEAAEEGHVKTVEVGAVEYDGRESHVGVVEPIG